MAGASVLAYIISEGMTDSANAEPGAALSAKEEKGQ